MNYNSMWRLVTQHGTLEQAERATEIRNRLSTAWQTEAQDEADMERLRELMEAAVQ